MQKLIKINDFHKEVIVGDKIKIKAWDDNIYIIVKYIDNKYVFGYKKGESDGCLCIIRIFIWYKIIEDDNIEELYQYDGVEGYTFEDVKDNRLTINELVKEFSNMKKRFNDMFEKAIK